MLQLVKTTVRGRPSLHSEHLAKSQTKGKTQFPSLPDVLLLYQWDAATTFFSNL